MAGTRGNILRGVAAGLVLGLAAAATGRSGVFRRLELLSVDARMNLASPADAPPIVIVGITQEDVRHRGPLPWSRRIYAQAVRKLERLGARVVVFDLYFSRPSPDPGEDRALAEAVRRAGTVILPAYAKVDPRERYGRYEDGVRWLDLPSDEYLERNLPVFAEAARRQGHINLSAQDPDHLFRHIPAAIGFRDTGAKFYALSVETAAAALEAEEPGRGRLEPTVSGNRLRIGSRSWPLDPFFLGCLQVDFAGVRRKVDVHAGRWRGQWGPHRSIFLYSFEEFLRDDFPREAVADRVVFLGSLLYERHPDVHPTPVGQQPGVIIHALAAQTLLGERTPHWLGTFEQGVLTVGLTLVLAVVCFTCRLRLSVPALAVMLAGLGGAALGLYEVRGLQIDTVAPATGFVLVFLLSVANAVAQARRTLQKRERELDMLVEMGRISTALVGGSSPQRMRLLEQEEADALVPPAGGLERAAETVAATMREVLGADVAACYMLAPDTRELSVVAASGVEGENLPEDLLNAGTAAARLAVGEKRPVLWSDGRRRGLRGGLRRMSAAGERVADLLCVPMTVGDGAAGAMVFFNKSATPVSPARRFTPEDLRLLTTLTQQAALTLENARLYQSMHGLFLDAIKSLAAAIDAKDPYTRGHTARVAQLCGFLGSEMALTAAELQVLQLAATLHDIGKIAIPEAVLNKPTSLTPEERRIIEKHPVRGAIILEPVRQLRPVIPGIRHHHERCDGAGYPDGLSGEDIPLLARIIAIADAFDAMTSDRPYRRALTDAEALEEVARNAGTQFDAQLVELFLRHFPNVRSVFSPAFRGAPE